MNRVSETPDEPAFVMATTEQLQALTWRELASAVSGFIVEMEPLNIVCGDRVLSAIPNSLMWIVTDLACQLRGWVHVAIDHQLPKSRIDAIAHLTQARVMLSDDSLQADRPSAQASNRCKATTAHIRFLSDQEHIKAFSGSADSCELPTAVNGLCENQPAQILFTSGTTGEQKGVVLSHRNLLSNAAAKLKAAPQMATDLRLNVLPFSHAYARTCELSTWILSGCRLAIARDWKTFIRVAPKLEPTLVNLVPALVNRARKYIEDDAKTSDRAAAAASLWGPRLRLMQVGGAALSADTWNFFAELGWPPLQGYGLTETSPVVCSNISGSQRCGTVGPPVDEVEIRIDSNRRLWTRGPHVMLGYWNDEAATKAKFDGVWFDTGDLAEFDSTGAIRILGRADDVLVLSSGYKVSPFELGQLLGEMPYIDQLLIVGQGRPYVGALVSPNFPALPPGLQLANGEQVRIDDQAFRLFLRNVWREQLKELPRPLHIECIGLLPEPMTVENGCLNFKGAVRRRHAEAYFTDAVDRLYASTTKPV